jgi:hypothetical protein
MPTLGEVIAEVQLTAAAVPSLLIRSWAKDVYAQLCAGSRWGWQRKTATVRVSASRSLAAVSLTSGQAAITSAALFLAADAGRQLWLGIGEPVVTILSVTDASNATLTANYDGTSGARSAEVFTAYYQPGSDFQQFVGLTDLGNQRPLPFWLTREQARLWDPSGVIAGQARALIAEEHVAPSVGVRPRIRYSWWPRNTVGGTYEVRYLAGPQVATLNEETEIPGVLADHLYVLKDGILARCAAYPGTPTTKNPYFNLTLAERLGTQYAVGRKDLSIVDDDQGPSQIIDSIDWRYVERGLSGDQAYQFSDASAAGVMGSSWYN